MIEHSNEKDSESETASIDTTNDECLTVCIPYLQKYFFSYGLLGGMGAYSTWMLVDIDKVVVIGGIEGALLLALWFYHTVDLFTCLIYGKAALVVRLSSCGLLLQFLESTFS